MARVPTLETFDNSIDLALKKIRANSEDFDERELWCGKMYVELHHKDGEWGTTSHHFNAQGTYTKYVDGRVMEGTWYQPTKSFNRIVVKYINDGGEWKEAYDMGFIGTNYCVVLKRHGRAILRDESKYVALLNENYFHEVETDWEDFIAYLYEDGQSFKLFEKVVMVVCVIVLTGLAIAFYNEFTGQNWF